MSDRPNKITVNLFKDKVLTNSSGKVLTIDTDLSEIIFEELAANGYVHRGILTEKFFEDLENESLILPAEVNDFKIEVLKIIGTVYREDSYQIEDANRSEIRLAEEINKENIAKVEFQKLWHTINHKSTYHVTFDEEELIEKSVTYLNDKLTVSQPTFNIKEDVAKEMNKADGIAFEIGVNSATKEYIKNTEIQVTYDLIGEITDLTDLTRKTVAQILNEMNEYKFELFKKNPEEFIIYVVRLINEQKSTQIVKHIEYHILNDHYDETLFTETAESGLIGNSNLLKANKSIYNYIKVDSKTEGKFQQSLEMQDDVKVYVKLPGSFKISTPLGNYNPDLAIAFKEGSVKHVYFVAETKGSMSTLQLKGSEQSKIECAKAHFRKLKRQGLLDDDHIYDVVSSYEELMEIVR